MPSTVHLIATDFADGPCQNFSPSPDEHWESVDGINGTFAALTITPHTDGWTADFGTIGNLNLLFYDADSGCSGEHEIEDTAVVTAKLVYTISTGDYTITWTSNGTDVIGTASATCPISNPIVVNGTIPTIWTTGSVLVTA